MYKNYSERINCEWKDNIESYHMWGYEPDTYESGEGQMEGWKMLLNLLANK